MEPFKWDRPPDAEENPGSRYRQRLGGQARPRVHSRYIHVKQELTRAQAREPPTIKPRLPPPNLFYNQ